MWFSRKNYFRICLVGYGLKTIFHCLVHLWNFLKSLFIIFTVSKGSQISEDKDVSPENSSTLLFKLFIRLLTHFSLVSHFYTPENVRKPLLFKLFVRLLTHFSPVSHLYTPWKRQKTFGFLTFSRGIEMWHWTKMG